MVAKKRASRRSKRQGSSTKVWDRILPYAALSFGSFVCFLLLLVLFIWKMDSVIKWGLAGMGYYLILVPLGLSVAAFLFGAMRSYARYTGKYLGGTLELGGPVLAFVSVVILGFKLAPPPDPDTGTFSFIVHVRDVTSGQEVAVTESPDHVTMELVQMESEPISDLGEAFFPAIPPEFKNRKVKIDIISNKYEVADPNRKHKLAGKSLTLRVRIKPGVIRGRVQDEHGRPLANVRIDVTEADLETRTGSNGSFRLKIPSNRMRKQFELRASTLGLEAWGGVVLPNSDEAELILWREEK